MFNPDAYPPPNYEAYPQSGRDPHYVNHEWNRTIPPESGLTQDQVAEAGLNPDAYRNQEEYLAASAAETVERQSHLREQQARDQTHAGVAAANGASASQPVQPPTATSTSKAELPTPPPVLSNSQKREQRALEQQQQTFYWKRWHTRLVWTVLAALLLIWIFVGIPLIEGTG